MGPFFMHINKVQLDRALSRAALIGENYSKKTGAHEDRRSVGILGKCIEEYTQKRISFQQLPLEDTTVKGACFVKADGSYEICCVESLPPEWKRFVLSKELSQVLIDQDQFRDMSLAEHVEGVWVGFPDDESHPRPSVVAEFLAEIAAMELLFPRRRRLLEVGNQSHARDVAARYGIPVIFAERYMKKQWLDYLSPENINMG